MNLKNIDLEEIVSELKKNWKVLMITKVFKILNQNT